MRACMMVYVISILSAAWLIELVSIERIKNSSELTVQNCRSELSE